MNIIDMVKAEMRKAENIYGPFRSTHEGLGVLTEEMSELIASIRCNRAGEVRTEAIQVAAVAARIAESMSCTATKERSGMSHA